MLPTYQKHNAACLQEKSIEDALEDGDLILKRCLYGLFPHTKIHHYPQDGIGCWPSASVGRAAAPELGASARSRGIWGASRTPSRTLSKTTPSTARR